MFRFANADDTALIVSILNEAADYLDSIGQTLWARDTLTAQAIGAVAHEFVVAADGSACVRTQASDELFWSDVTEREPPTVKSLFVHKLAVRRTRRAGIAAQLLAFVERHAKRRLGCTFVRLDCAIRPKLVEFYCQNGYAPHSTKSIPFYPWQVQRFEKQL